jgi:hypothetical protein
MTSVRGRTRLANYHPTSGNLQQSRPDARSSAGPLVHERPSGRERLRATGARIYTAARTRANRANFLRLLGVALIVYGAVGLAATLYGYALVRQAFASARELGVAAPGQRSSALSGLQSISATLDDAAKTSANMTSSFKESQTSLTTASQVATDVATSFRQVAQVAGFQIFGLQPMAGMIQPFQESSARLDALAQDLTSTSAAVGANAGDMQRLSADFARLKTEVDGLTRSVAALPTDPTSGEGARRLETALTAMLVWIGLQGVASIFAGLAVVLLPLTRRNARQA